MAIQRSKSLRRGFRYKPMVRDHIGQWMKSHTWDRKIDAEAEERELLEARDKGTYRRERYAPLSFHDAAHAWFDDLERRECSFGYMCSVKGNMNRYLIPHLGELDIKSIVPSDISALIKKLLDKGVKPKTINGALKDLRTMFNFHVEEESIISNPVKKKHKIKLLQGERVEIVWTLEEATRFLEYADKKYSGECRWPYLMYKIALNAGLRYGEIIALEYEDFDFENSRIKISKSYNQKIKEIVTPKSKRVRYAPLSPDLAEEVRRYHITSGPLFYNRKKRRYQSYNTFRSIHYLRDIEQAGVRKTKFHNCRRFFVMNFLMGGGIEAQLRKIVGHASRQMTDLYNSQVEDMSEIGRMVQV